MENTMNEEIKKFLEELLAKNGGVITANALDEILKKFGSTLADEIKAKYEEDFGRVEQLYTQNDLNKPKGAFKNFADYVMAVKNYQTDENQNKLKTLETGVQGDFLIPTEYAGGILDFGDESNSFMAMCQKFPLNGNSFSYPYYKSKNRTSANFYGGVVSYWVEEGNAPTASDMQFGKINFRLHDLEMLIPATNDMVEDAPMAVAGLVNSAFSKRLAYDLENVFLNGNGAGQPLGILNSGALITQAKDTSQASNSITSGNLLKMKSRLPNGSKRNAIWIYSLDVEPEIQGIKIGASDAPAFIAAGSFSNDSGLDRILGRPAYVSEHLSASLGTTKDIVLVDPSQYGVAYKGTFTPQVESSAHLYFDSNKTAFRLVFRIDGQPLWETSITPAQGSITKSPIVVLATRT